MLLEEFMELTAEMENFFTTKLDKVPKKIWFKNLEFLNKSEYEYVLNECYKNSKFMPKLAEILEIYNKQKGQTNSEPSSFDDVNLDSSYWYENLRDFCDGLRFDENTGKFIKTNQTTPYYDITKGVDFPLSPYKTKSKMRN